MTATHKQQLNKRHGFDKDESHSLAKIAKISGMSLSKLRTVYNRGIGAYKTNPTSVRTKDTFKKNTNAPMKAKLSKEQWAKARVYAFVNKIESKQTLNHDTDLR